MNSRKLYTEIGNIDNDLIIAAESYKRNRSRTFFNRIVGIAACICVVLCGVLFINDQNSVYINTISEPEAAKSVIPSEEDVIIVSLNFADLINYFEIEKIINVLENDYKKMEQSDYYIYKNSEGKILYDTNVLFFKNAEETKIFSVTLSTKENIIEKFDDIKYSKIKGVPIIFAKYLNSEGNTEYFAVTDISGANIKITAEGFGEKEFVDMIKQLMKSVK